MSFAMRGLTVRDLREHLSKIEEGHGDISDWEVEIEVAMANDGPVYRVPCNIVRPWYEGLVLGSSEDIGS